MFDSGLKEDVRKLLISRPTPNSLIKMQHYAVQCNDLLYQFKTSTSSKSKSKPQSSSEKSFKSSTKKFSPLTPEEKQHRCDNQLCLYCGE
jgi:hypothetical protein